MPLLDMLLKDKPKSWPDTVAKLINALNQLEVPAPDATQEKNLQSVSKYLGYLKVFLFGTEEHEVTKEDVLRLARELVSTDLLYLLVKHLALLDFETRKDAAQVFGATVRIKERDDMQSPGAKYVLQHPYIISKLFHGYDEPNIALNCGAMLRDCMRDDALARQFLESEMFMDFFDRVEMANFEIASDAFLTFKDLLTRHKVIVAQYLMHHYTEFFPAYTRLLKSNNYVTRRQSLKLLGELLLHRDNTKVMLRYVGDVQYLMQMMLLLKDPARNIQFEAFHVFKVFVVNPNKPQPIIDILANNKEKLLKYLEDFLSERDDSDENFKEEKAVLIREISTLGPPSHQQQQSGSNSQSSSHSQTPIGAPPLSQQQAEGGGS